MKHKEFTGRFGKFYSSWAFSVVGMSVTIFTD